MRASSGNKSETGSSSVDEIEKLILNYVGDSHRRLTRPMLVKTVSRRASANRKKIDSAVRSLIDSGQLAYTYEHGCSFVELSFLRAVRISGHVVLKPPGIDYVPGPRDIVVVIHPGASFGTGRHPSSRLAVRGIEYALNVGTAQNAATLLDIGTGSGILMIAALLMGVRRAVGLDTDPCARAEARENAAANGIADRVNIDARDLSDIGGRFSMVTANLRSPTLARLADNIAGLTASQGHAVLSGIKANEIEELKGAYEGRKLSCVWEAVEKEWAAVVLQKHF